MNEPRPWVTRISEFFGYMASRGWHQAGIFMQRRQQFRIIGMMSTAQVLRLSGDNDNSPFR
jgi:hypothetical protein